MANDNISLTAKVFREIQAEIEATKAGTLPEAKARIAATQRGNQIRVMEVDLKFQRLMRTSVSNGEPHKEPLLTLNGRVVRKRKKIAA